VQPSPVVEPLDVVEHRGADLGSGGPGAAVDELELQRGEEALGDGAIPGTGGVVTATG
jgi:hypothetical protein